MEENKKMLLSGRLTGTRSFSSTLEEIENPDEIEQFLLYFSNLKIESEKLQSHEVKYIYSDAEFEIIKSELLNENCLGIYASSDFSKLYISINSHKAFIIDLNNVSSSNIATIIADENLIKYSINTFLFIKWCNSQNIDIKSLFDIPTYIKLLTNDIDSFENAVGYLTKYTNYILSPSDTEKNVIALTHFVYEMGNILSQFIEKFELSTINKLINENSYYEGNSFESNGNCKIKFSYLNTSKAIEAISSQVLANFQDKAYLVSPLNRIAPKFKQDASKLVTELYSEDLSLTILNELYNNNIPVTLNDNLEYIITCKYKNFTNILNILNAIFVEVFSALFDQTPEIHIECILKD